MNNRQMKNANRDIVWLTATYSPMAKGWFIDNTYPPFIKRTEHEAYHVIEGVDVVYMVRGFEHYEDAKQFAIDYHEAKRDGLVSRFRLD